MGILGVLIVLAVIVVVPVLVIVGMYNGLVKIRNQCDEAWADIETEMQRRYDLIPNLVNTVKGYASHEKELLENVTRLREQAAANHGSPGEQAAAEGQLMGALGQLMVRLERYPDLKANQNFLELQRELTNTEDRMQAANRFYNGNVRENNNKVQMFPTNIVAGVFGFKVREFFEIRTEEAREAPKVEF